MITLSIVNFSSDADASVRYVARIKGLEKWCTKNRINNSDERNQIVAFLNTYHDIS